MLIGDSYGLHIGGFFSGEHVGNLDFRKPFFK